jgi:hypothetical protein
MSKYSDLQFLTNERMIDYLSGDPLTSPNHKQTIKVATKTKGLENNQLTEQSIHQYGDVDGWYSIVQTKSMIEPYVAVVSKEACQYLYIDYISLFTDYSHLDLLSGVKAHTNSSRYSYNYAGHQYGVCKSTLTKILPSWEVEGQYPEANSSHHLENDWSFS